MKTYVKNLEVNNYSLFKNVGIVVGVTDGIVTILGMSNVAYVKLLIL